MRSRRIEGRSGESDGAEIYSEIQNFDQIYIEEYDALAVKCVVIAGHFHSMASRRIRCFILLADAAVLTPRWRRLRLRLRIEHQEHLGRDELQLFVDVKLKCGVGDATIPIGHMRHSCKFRNVGLRKDVLALLVGEIELL